MTNDLKELTYDTLNSIVKNVTGEEEDAGRYSNIVAKGVTFHTMYHRGNVSGIELSIRDVDWKKSSRRVRSVNGQISISRLKISYGELREMYDAEIHPKVVERKRRDNKVRVLNELACSIKDASVTVYHDSTLRRGFSVSVEGGEELIEDCLSFLEQRCGRKDVSLD